MSGLFGSLVARAAGLRPVTPVVEPRPVARFEPTGGAALAALDAEQDAVSSVHEASLPRGVNRPQADEADFPEALRETDFPPPFRFVTSDEGLDRNTAVRLDHASALSAPPVIAASAIPPAMPSILPAEPGVTAPARQDASLPVSSRPPHIVPEPSPRAGQQDFHLTEAPKLVVPETSSRSDAHSERGEPTLRPREAQRFEPLLAAEGRHRHQSLATANLGSVAPIAPAIPPVAVSIGRIEVVIAPAPAARPAPERTRGFAGYEDIRRGRR